MESVVLDDCCAKCDKPAPVDNFLLCTQMIYVHCVQSVVVFPPFFMHRKSHTHTRTTNIHNGLQNSHSHADHWMCTTNLEQIFAIKRHKKCLSTYYPMYMNVLIHLVSLSFQLHSYVNTVQFDFRWEFFSTEIGSDSIRKAIRVRWLMAKQLCVLLFDFSLSESISVFKQVV